MLSENNIMTPLLKMKALLVLSVLALGLSVFSCGSKDTARRASSSPSRDPIAADGVERISIDDLQDALENGDAVLVDVRGRVDFQLGHIGGARSIPLGLLTERASELPRDKKIVTYCT